MENIHLQPGNKRSSLTLLLLLVPVIAFVLSIIIVAKNKGENTQRAASIESETVVLGESIEK